MTDTQRIAVITGASSAISLEVAGTLAREGGPVIGSGRDASRMAGAQQIIGDRARDRGSIEFLAA